MSVARVQLDVSSNGDPRALGFPNPVAARFKGNLKNEENDDGGALRARLYARYACICPGPGGASRPRAFARLSKECCGGSTPFDIWKER
jgi:hypothetical protein